MDNRKRAETVRKRLEKEYGRPINNESQDPLSTLIHTILSQNTTDVTSERAWKALRGRYRNWQFLAKASVTDLAETIRVSGLSQIKAERIIGALADIKHLTGKYSLDFLRDMDEQEADKWLSQLKGVGPKTRAIILLFSLRKKAFPVDTHIFRVTKRIGLVSKTAARDEVQRNMAALAKPADYFSFHVNLIQHGRSVCSALNPQCLECIIFDICQWPDKRIFASKSKRGK